MKLQTKISNMYQAAEETRWLKGTRLLGGATLMGGVGLLNGSKILYFEKRMVP